MKPAPSVTCISLAKVRLPNPAIPEFYLLEVHAEVGTRALFTIFQITDFSIVTGGSVGRMKH
jgi:hypothetical protein